MKNKTLTSSDLTSSRTIRDLPREIAPKTHEPSPAQEMTFDTAESLKKSASLSTCDTFHAGFLTGIFLAPHLRK